MSQRTEIQSAMRNQPWLVPWPKSDLSPVKECPVCASTRRSLLYEDLADNVFYCAPGKWTSYSCSDCGSMYLDPRPSSTSIHMAYTTYYTHEMSSQRMDYALLNTVLKLRRRLINGYNSWRYSCNEVPRSRLGWIFLSLAWPLNLQLDRNYRHLPKLPKNGGALLDIGCGSGGFLMTALTCGWKATGVDFDHKAVQICRSQGLDVLHGGVELFEGQVGLFDVITCSHVIEHLPDPLGMLKACQNLLKPGGQLWLETPNIDSLGHREYRRNWRGLEPPRHLVIFNSKSLKGALNATGFVRISSKATPSSLLKLSKSSQNIKLGRAIGLNYEFSSFDIWNIRRKILLQMFKPSYREFLTVVAFKAGDQYTNTDMISDAVPAE